MEILEHTANLDETPESGTCAGNVVPIPTDTKEVASPNSGSMRVCIAVFVVQYEDSDEEFVGETVDGK